jgi:hypothetical protein
MIKLTAWDEVTNVAHYYGVGPLLRNFSEHALILGGSRFPEQHRDQRHLQSSASFLMFWLKCLSRGVFPLAAHGQPADLGRRRDSFLEDLQALSIHFGVIEGCPR